MINHGRCSREQQFTNLENGALLKTTTITKTNSSSPHYLTIILYFSSNVERRRGSPYLPAKDYHHLARDIGNIKLANRHFQIIGTIAV
jgi:hypothetical protein